MLTLDRRINNLRGLIQKAKSEAYPSSLKNETQPLTTNRNISKPEILFEDGESQQEELSKYGAGRTSSRHDYIVENPNSVTSRGRSNLQQRKSSRKSSFFEKKANWTLEILKKRKDQEKSESENEEENGQEQQQQTNRQQQEQKPISKSEKLKSLVAKISRKPQSKEPPRINVQVPPLRYGPEIKSLVQMYKQSREMIKKYRT